MSHSEPTEPELRPQGLTFEDFEPGRAFRTPGRTISEADVLLFAGLSGDLNPVHVDELVAKRTPFRGRVAHGMLVQSIATGLAVQTGIFHGTLNALASMEIRWLSPVRAGDTLGVVLTVQERDAEPSPRRGRVRFQVSITNQDQTVVSESVWETVVLRRRP